MFNTRFLNNFGNNTTVHLLIYSPHITTRLVYITNWIFTGVYKIPYRLTDNLDRFLQQETPRINYSEENIPGVPQILPCGLLSEKDIRFQSISFKENGENKYPFAVGDDLLGFDVFAAAFYFITRYEEYLPYEPDVYGRFTATSSLIHKMGMLYRPVADEWLALLKTKLLLPHSEEKNRFTPLFTYDVDTAYAFLGRPSRITNGHLIKDFVTGKFNAIRQRMQVLKGINTDPFDTYNDTIAFTRKHKLDTIFFFLLGNPNKYNRNLPHTHELQQNLVKKISAETATGLHPSYYSEKDPALLQEEKHRMEAITGQRVVKSRQHYLRFCFPDTYRQLAAAGIQEDYSMGFAETPGFRAGTSFPFYFFDLEQNVTTTLKVFPITFMEGSFAEDMRMEPEAAYPVMLQLLEAVKKVNGLFCCIWHNHTLSNHGMWKGWKAIHDRIAQAATTTAS